MSEIGSVSVNLDYTDKPQCHRDTPAYRLSENIKLLKNTTGEILSCLNRVKSLVMSPFTLPFAIHNTFCQIMNKVNTGLQEKAFKQIDKMLKECIDKGKTARDETVAALGQSTHWAPERIEKLVDAALLWGSAEHNREATTQIINEMSEQHETTELTAEQQRELTELQKTLKDQEKECEESFARMTNLNKDCSESARLKNLDIIGGFLLEYLDVKTTVLLLSFAMSFPYERVTAVSAKMGLQLRFVVPESKNPFTPFNANDRPKKFTIEGCGYVEAALSKTLNILKQYFGVATSTADLYAQARTIIRRRVFVSAGFELNEQQKYQKIPGITVSYESVLRGYGIVGVHALGGAGASCSTLIGRGSEKHSYSLTDEWLKLAVIFLGTLSCGAVAYTYVDDKASDQLMAAIGSMIASSHLLTTILPARNRTDMSIINWAPGIKAGVIDHQGTKIETTFGGRWISKYIPKTS